MATAKTEVVIVGMGAVGAILAAELSRAGLRVVGLERGARLNEGALGPAYAFAHQNPGDPRPWLLIGHAYAQLDWLSDSVERYQRAYRADPTCRGDPQMLEDLLKAVTHRVAGRKAARAIHDIYGAEALPALEKAIARGAGDRDGNDSLDHLRDLRIRPPQHAQPPPSAPRCRARLSAECRPRRVGSPARRRLRRPPSRG